MPLSWMPWPIRQCGSSLPTLVRRFRRATNRPLKRSALFKGPRWRSGGPSSKRQTSKRNELARCGISEGNAMKRPRRAFLHLAAGAAALPAFSRIAWAQTYPSRPITIVAPFPAGGATDIVSRTLAEGMKAPLGQTILVENVTGASGTIGSGRVVCAEPDGYTLVIGQWSSHVGA